MGRASGTVQQLACIAHKLATTTADASVLTAFCFVGLLDVLHEYDCGGLGRKSCQNGASTVSLRKPMRNAGYDFGHRQLSPPCRDAHL